MEGLEISILSLAEIRASSPKLRIDGGYFGKAALAAERKVANRGNERFDNVSSVFRKGIFDIRAETYVSGQNGVPFVRIGDLRSGLIQKDTMAHISREAHRSEVQTRLVRGDLVVSKTAYPAAAMVNVPECNVSQDIIAVRLNRRGREYFTPGFVAAFLNAEQGEMLMARRFQGNVQRHLSLADGKEIRIPRLDMAFQQGVQQLMEDADAVWDRSRVQRRSVEQALLQTIGLSDWQPEDVLWRAAGARNVFGARRLDAKYFASNVEDLVAQMEGSGIAITTVRDIRAHNGRGLQPDYVSGGDVRVINSRHILESGIDYAELERTDGAWLDRNRKAQVKPGDILTYATGAKIGRTAHFSMAGDVVASNHVNILRLRTGYSVYVALVLNCVVGRVQTHRYMSGSAQPELYSTEIDKFVIPLAPEAVQDEIARESEGAEKLARRARWLLDAAKRSVEVAIGDGDCAGIRFLEEIREDGR